jgi:segregation and condensation protein B
LSQGLIEEIGRMDTPGRPILYGTTPEFLQHFGLRSIEDLPELEKETLEDDPLLLAGLSPKFEEEE